MSEESNRHERIRKLINSEGETHADGPVFSRPELDANDMPLPRRVSEIDSEGTRVTPAAFEPTTSRRSRTRPKVRLTNRNLFLRYGVVGCIVQILIGLVFIFVIFGLCLLSLGVYEYYSISSS